MCMRQCHRVNLRPCSLKCTALCCRESIRWPVKWKSTSRIAAWPRRRIVGLPDAAVKESIERVRFAIVNCGYPFPMSRQLVSLAPADIRKEGPLYDLPIAVGLLLAKNVI